MSRLGFPRVRLALLALVATTSLVILLAAPGSGGAQMTATPDSSPDATDGVARDNPGSEDADSGSNDDPVWGYFLGKSAYIFFQGLTATLARQHDLRAAIDTPAKRSQLTSLLLATEAHKRFGAMALGDAVVGWVISWRQAQRDDAATGGDAVKLDSWDGRNITPPQMSDLLCTIYGSDPTHFRSLIESGDLTVAAAASCAAAYAPRRAQWTTALQKVGIKLRSDAGATGTAQPTQTASSLATPSLIVEQQPSTASELADFTAWLSDVAVFNNLATETNRDLALATSIKVVLLQCNSATMTTEVPSDDMPICYEMLKAVYDAATTQNVEAPPE